MQMRQKKSIIFVLFVVYRQDVRWPNTFDMTVVVAEEWQIMVAPLKNPFTTWREKDSDQAGNSIDILQISGL